MPLLSHFLNFIIDRIAIKFQYYFLYCHTYFVRLTINRTKPAIYPRPACTASRKRLSGPFPYHDIPIFCWQIQFPCRIMKTPAEQTMQFCHIVFPANCVSRRSAADTGFSPSQSVQTLFGDSSKSFYTLFKIEAYCIYSSKRYRSAGARCIHCPLTMRGHPPGQEQTTNKAPAGPA